MTTKYTVLCCHKLTQLLVPKGNTSPKFKILGEGTINAQNVPPTTGPSLWLWLANDVVLSHVTAADIDGTDITSEVTSPDLQTDDVTLPPASDGSAVDEPVDEASEADSDASLSFADKDVVDNSASTSHTERSAAFLTVVTNCWAHSSFCIQCFYILYSLGRRSFAVAGPTTWNSLSADLRGPTCSDESFKRSLKTFLFAKY